MERTQGLNDDAAVEPEEEDGERHVAETGEQGEPLVTMSGVVLGLERESENTVQGTNAAATTSTHVPPPSR